MTFPDFFAQIPPITLRDPLAELLGAAEDGLIEYHFCRCRQTRRPFLPHRSRRLADDGTRPACPLWRRNPAAWPNQRCPQ
jgi:hypothetical protein